MAARRASEGKPALAESDCTSPLARAAGCHSFILEYVVNRYLLVILSLVAGQDTLLAQALPLTPAVPSENTLAESYLNARRPRRDAIGLETEGSEGERAEELETDRDSFTPATTLVGRGKTMLESAYTFSDNRSSKEGHSFPELLIRYGLSERVELRLGWNYEIGGVSESGGVEAIDARTLEKESEISYGIKFLITESKEWMPRSSIILAGFTPTSGNVNNTQLVATYVFGWEFANRWALDAAIRYGTDSEEHDHFNDWAPSVVLKIPLGEKIKVHAEYFAIFSSGRAEETNKQFFSPGVHYLVTENLEIGTRVGWGLNDQSARFFVNAGIGWRF
jgi:hypothetical protein